MPQLSKVKGKGDYDFDFDSQPKVPKSNPLLRIESKIDNLSHTMKPVKSSAGSMIGRGLGSLLGQGELGATAGDALSKWFGHGDYELKSNSLVKAVQSGTQIPVFTKDGRRGTRIVEREYIGDVISSGTSNTFNVVKYRVNPADPASFPWLSVIAQQYDEWEPNGIIYEYKTTSGTFNGSTQALGIVTMMTDYDVRDDTPFSKLQMENADYACSTVASNNLEHGLECDPNERPARVLYTGATSPTDSANARFSDLGNFYIATSGVSGAGVVLGELWISYDVTLYKKQLFGGQLGLNIAIGSVEATDGSTANITYPLGTQQRIWGSLLTYNPVTKTVTFPPSVQTGRYLLIFFSTASTTTLRLALDTLTNMELATTNTVPPMWDNTGFGVVNPEAYAADQSVMCRFVNITKSPASFTVKGTFAPTGNQSSRMIVMQAPDTSSTYVVQ